jgi:hypothetical protein
MAGPCYVIGTVANAKFKRVLTELFEEVAPFSKFVFVVHIFVLFVVFTSRSFSRGMVRNANVQDFEMVGGNNFQKPTRKQDFSWLH